MQKLGQASGQPGIFETEVAGEDVVWSLSPDYRSSLAGEGSLGESEAYRSVVSDDEGAASILFVDFDAGNWLDGLAQMDPAVAENVQPLSALGLTGWTDDGTSHGVLRLSTD
jgi:hypothetical protein